MPPAEPFPPRAAPPHPRPTRHNPPHRNPPHPTPSRPTPPLPSPPRPTRRPTLRERRLISVAAERAVCLTALRLTLRTRSSTRKSKFMDVPNACKFILRLSFPRHVQRPGRHATSRRVVTSSLGLKASLAVGNKLLRLKGGGWGGRGHRKPHLPFFRVVGLQYSFGCGN